MTVPLHGGQKPGSSRRMGLDNAPLLFREELLLLEEVTRYGQFTYVVEHGSDPELKELLVGKTHDLTQLHRGLGHP